MGLEGEDNSQSELQSPVSRLAQISDTQLLPLIEATVDIIRPREWYYGLMDYGAELAKRVPNPNRASKHYSRQSQFEGSLRQLRGRVLRQLLRGSKSASELKIDDPRLAEVLNALVREGFLTLGDGTFSIAR